MEINDQFQQTWRQLQMNLLAMLAIVYTIFASILIFFDDVSKKNNLSFNYHQDKRLEFDNFTNVKDYEKRSNILKKLLGKPKGTKVFITKKVEPSTPSEPITYSTEKVRMHKGRILIPKEKKTKSLINSSTQKLNSAFISKKKASASESIKSENNQQPLISSLKKAQTTKGSKQVRFANDKQKSKSIGKRSLLNENVLQKRSGEPRRKRKLQRIPSSESFSRPRSIPNSTKNHHNRSKSHPMSPMQEDSSSHPQQYHHHHINKVSKTISGEGQPSVSSLGRGIGNLYIDESLSNSHSNSSEEDDHHHTRNSSSSPPPGKSKSSNSRNYSTGGSSTRSRMAIIRQDSTLSTATSEIPDSHNHNNRHHQIISPSSPYSDHSLFEPDFSPKSPRHQPWWIGSDSSRSSDSD